MKITCNIFEQGILDKVAIAAGQLQVEAYLIGGFVRDKLLGRVTKDMDIVCTGDGIALAHAVAGLVSIPTQVNFFKNFGTAHIRVQDPVDQSWLDVEFVGARKESYRAESRKPDVQPGTIEDDQNRRDFTINAMAISLNGNNFGELIDPFDGEADLEKKIIRTPLEPSTTFSDDPLRMMRAIRFAAQLEFRIEQPAIDAISHMAERISIISQERITDELKKIVSSRKPSIGFELLFRTGLLHIIFPPMVELAGAEYRDGHGHKDNFTHTLQVLDNVACNSDDHWLRWAAILHDIAKPATKRYEEGHGWTFHGHEVVGGRMVPKIFAKLKLPQQEEMRFVRKMVELHLRPISLTKENITDSAIRRLLFDAGNDFDSLMILCDADITSKNRQKVKRYQENFQLVRQRCREVEERDQLRNWQPPVDGGMIMEMFGLAPSKPVGLLKDSLKDAILDGVIPNTLEAAIAFLEQKAAGMGLNTKKS
ncbi:MAG: HD domain-containing protein [Chitinophagaceae bacterium]|nr:MAG: HD domain-containing protein [Chitinophagaceae bacterium]